MPVPAYEKLGAFYLGRRVDSHNGKDTDELVMLDSRDLTTHAVCVGMTGSGKTGLCLSLLEEAALDGVPILAIDPKGDIANLGLQFPQLRGSDFMPWIDVGEAQRNGQTPEQLAQVTADKWKEGLAQWQQDGERIQRLRDSAEVTIYTPGSHAGRGLSILRSLTAPDAALREDPTAWKDHIGGVASGLLGLIGVDADPLKSREHILLSTLFDTVWRDGEALDLAGLIRAIQQPPFTTVGVFDLETFFPAKERLALAMLFNNLLAAPGFSTWLEGEALDAQRLLFTATGKPRIAVVSIAHLNDAERMFVVTLLLNEMVAWMRKQSGTSSLRALLYMDEIFGYFPPSAMPASKLPLLTLMKQARAFGLGVVLATQNPVDLDYKGLSNAGMWFIGRLQTERDKARVIDGLLSGADAGVDRPMLEALLSNLSQRVFLLRNVHEDEPLLLRCRWALSYLRGPLTLAEISRLAPPASAPPIQPATPVTTAAKFTAKPLLPVGVNEYYHTAGSGQTTYVPALLGRAKVHFVDGSAGVDAWQTRTFIASLNEAGSAPDWAAAHTLMEDSMALKRVADPAVAYAELPAALLRSANYAAWAKDLSAAIYQTATQTVYRCAALKLTSIADENEGAFRARLSIRLREERDARVERLRQQYASRLATLQDQLTRARQRIEREQAQLSQQKLQTVLSVGATLLSAFMGRKALSTGNVSRAATAVHSAGRISRESQDVDQATDSLETLQRRWEELNAELEQRVARIQDECDPAAVVLDTIDVKPRKSDTVVSEVAVVWQAV